MIIDDDLDCLPLYEMIDTIPDTILTVQTGGLMALDMLHRLNYDVDAVVLDLCMPDRDGLSVTRDIRREENIRSKVRPIEIFWMTSWDTDHDETLKAARQKYGVRKIFEKPVDAEYVVRSVKDCLECINLHDRP